MNPEHEEPINFFGVNIDQALKFKNKVVATDGIFIFMIDASGKVWISPLISWDGITDLRIDGDVLHGKVNALEAWIPFSLNLETKEMQGGLQFDIL